MPVPFLEKLAKQHSLSKQHVEKLWDRAKFLARKAGKKEKDKDFYAYVTGIVEHMAGGKTKEKANIQPFHDIDDELNSNKGKLDEKLGYEINDIIGKDIDNDGEINTSSVQRLTKFIQKALTEDEAKDLEDTYKQKDDKEEKEDSKVESRLASYIATSKGISVWDQHIFSVPDIKDTDVVRSSWFKALSQAKQKEYLKLSNSRKRDFHSKKHEFHYNEHLENRKRANDLADKEGRSKEDLAQEIHHRGLSNEHRKAADFHGGVAIHLNKSLSKDHKKNMKWDKNAGTIIRSSVESRLNYYISTVNKKDK